MQNFVFSKTLQMVCFVKKTDIINKNDQIYMIVQFLLVVYIYFPIKDEISKTDSVTSFSISV